MIKPVLSGMWAVAGMDAMLLGLALLAAWTAGSEGVPAMMSALLLAAAGLASYGDQT